MRLGDRTDAGADVRARTSARASDPTRDPAAAIPQARAFLERSIPSARIERFAIAGGMPRYLSELGRGDVKDAICSRVLDRNGPLWNEGRAVLEQELKQPGIYFSILEQLATGEKDVEDRLRRPDREHDRQPLSLNARRAAHRASQAPRRRRPSSRTGHWELNDPFLRFWFRFVFRFQTELETGLRARGPMGEHRKPALSDTWRLCSRISAVTGRARTMGNGSACRQLVGQRPQRPPPYRQRTSEEIDIVGPAARPRHGDRRVPLAQQSDGRQRPPGDRGLQAPRAGQAGHKIDENPRILLFSRSGYSSTLKQADSKNERPRLVRIDEVAVGLQR